MPCYSAVPLGHPEGEVPKRQLNISISRKRLIKGMIPYKYKTFMNIFCTIIMQIIKIGYTKMTMTIYPCEL